MLVDVSWWYSWCWKMCEWMVQRRENWDQTKMHSSSNAWKVSKNCTKWLKSIQTSSPWDPKHVGTTDISGYIVAGLKWMPLEATASLSSNCFSTCGFGSWNSYKDQDQVFTSPMHTLTGHILGHPTTAARSPTTMSPSLWGWCFDAFGQFPQKQNMSYPLLI